MTNTGVKIKPLTGKALLQKVKELAHLPRRERAKASGYYTVTKDKQIRINLTDFYDALLAARGVLLSFEASKENSSRESTYRVSVHKNGQIVISATYTDAMGLKPGDEFEIRLGYKHIHLIQIESDTGKNNEGKMDNAHFLEKQSSEGKAFKAYLESEEKWSGVYRRLADS